MRQQSGFTLIEAVIATAIVAIGFGGLLYALSGFARFTAHQVGPVRTAALRLADRTLRIAQDTWKYGSPGGAPSGSLSTSMPVAMPRATSVPVLLTTTVLSTSSTGALLAVTVRYTPDPGHPGDTGSVTRSAQTQIDAPLPGSRVIEPNPIAQPSGTP